jgi:hypothetical protein
VDEKGKKDERRLMREKRTRNEEEMKEKKQGKIKSRQMTRYPVLRSKAE